MPSKNEEQLTFISIPRDGELVHSGNRIIFAKRNPFGEEIEPEAEDFTIQTAPDWFKPNMLKPLCCGLLEDRRIILATVYRRRLVLQVADCLEQPSTPAEIVLIPKNSEARFMLALYLVEVFDCLAQIELSWEKRAATSPSEFRLLSESIDKRIKVAGMPTVKLDDSRRAAPETVAPVTIEKPEAKVAKTPKKPKAKALSPRTTANPKVTSAKPVSPNPTSTKKAFAGNISSDIVTDIIRRLEGKGLFGNGRAKTTHWTLLDCAKYVSVVSSVIKDRFQIITYIQFLNEEYGLPNREKIEEYLGDNTAEWISNARGWLE